MSRVPLATLAGLLLITVWIGAAMVLSDHVRGMNAVVQFVYFAIAGFAWVFPVRWLMLWSVHKR